MTHLVASRCKGLLLLESEQILNLADFGFERFDPLLCRLGGLLSLQLRRTVAAAGSGPGFAAALRSCCLRFAQLVLQLCDLLLQLGLQLRE